MNATISSTRTIRPIIFWDGFPVCGLLVKKIADEYKDNLVILATRSKVPFPQLETELGHPIIYLDTANDIWKRKEEWADRNLVIHTGWRYHGWLKYDAYMKKRGAKIVGMVDNRYRGDLRQWMGAIFFRLSLRKYFDAVLVPGKSGTQLMRFLGMLPSKIYTGLYGAYEGIFQETASIEVRNKEFLFVGQLIARKGIDMLVEAFTKYKKAGGTWTLRIVGDGPLASICNGEGIILESSALPYAVVKKMNSARVLVLPSRDDNWGTVVCEAAACGMQLITTATVGASVDIVQDGTNGAVLTELDAEKLVSAFFQFERMSNADLTRGSKISKEVATRHDSRAYYESFLKIVRDLFDSKEASK